MGLLHCSCVCVCVCVCVYLMVCLRGHPGSLKVLMLPSFSSAVISLSFTERNRIFHCQNMHWSKHTVSILTSQKRKSNVTTSIRLQGKCLSCENSRSGSFCHYQCPYSWLQLRVAIQNNKEAGILGNGKWSQWGPERPTGLFTANYVPYACQHSLSSRCQTLSKTQKRQ
jgi:hypothetical protein